MRFEDASHSLALRAKLQTRLVRFAEARPPYGGRVRVATATRLWKCALPARLCAGVFASLFSIKQCMTILNVTCNEIRPLLSAPLSSPATRLRCLAVLFILAIHGSTSVW